MTRKQEAKKLEKYGPESLGVARELFPEFKWRVIQSHEFERTCLRLSIDDGKPDPRTLEEMSKRGRWNDHGDYVRFRKQPDRVAKVNFRVDRKHEIKGV